MAEPVLDNGSQLLDFPKLTDERGSLTFLEGSEHVPFDIRRVYYIYDVPKNQTRGEHAHEDLDQVLVAVSGQFKVEIDDGRSRTTVTLDSPDEGLYLTGLTWREMRAFSEHAVCLVLASDYYDEDDYVHNYEEFQRLSRVK